MKADCGVNYTFNRIIPKFLSAVSSNENWMECSMLQTKDDNLRLARFSSAPKVFTPARKAI